MKSDQRQEYKGPIDTNEVDKLLADSSIAYYFWTWNTLTKHDVPLLQVFIGNNIVNVHVKFRALMLEKEVRVKFINHSDSKGKISH